MASRCCLPGTGISNTESRSSLSSPCHPRAAIRALAGSGLFTLCLAALASGATSLEDPWARLADARDSLSRGPLAAAFAQTFVPAGFSTGERETGRVLLGLPSCLRWDYETPYPKSFLICEETVWSWNEGESTGRKHTVEAGEDETGLDLLRLSVERLRDRYEARAEPVEDGRLKIVLVPLEPGARITRAGLTIETGNDRPVEITYLDLEGNTTRFELSGYRPVDEAGGLSPPADFEWLDE